MLVGLPCTLVRVFLFESACVSPLHMIQLGPNLGPHLGVGLIAASANARVHRCIVRERLRRRDHMQQGSGTTPTTSQLRIFAWTDSTSERPYNQTFGAPSSRARETTIPTCGSSFAMLALQGAAPVTSSVNRAPVARFSCEDPSLETGHASGPPCVQPRVFPPCVGDHTHGCFFFIAQAWANPQTMIRRDSSAAQQAATVVPTSPSLPPPAASAAP